MLLCFSRGLRGLKVYEVARNADDETGYHRLRWNIRFLSSESKQWHIPKYADTKTYYTMLESNPPPPFLNKPLPMHTKRLVARRWMDFVLCLRAHMHAWLRRAVILVWFHLHARDPFVFIIITRLEETDLLGLVEMAMPLCLQITKKTKHNNQLRCPDVCHVNTTQAGDG